MQFITFHGILWHMHGAYNQSTLQVDQFKIAVSKSLSDSLLLHSMGKFASSGECLHCVWIQVFKVKALVPSTSLFQLVCIKYHKCRRRLCCFACANNGVIVWAQQKQVVWTLCNFFVAQITSPSKAVRHHQLNSTQRAGTTSVRPCWWTGPWHCPSPVVWSPPTLSCARTSVTPSMTGEARSLAVSPREQVCCIKGLFVSQGSRSWSVVAILVYCTIH